MLQLSWIIVTACLVQNGLLLPFSKHEDDSRYWENIAIKQLLEAKSRSRDNRIAKNVILFIGDGMSTATLTAARIYKGELNQQYGEEGTLLWETFPHLAAVKTYCADRQVTDSAASATALMCGIKTNYETLGVNAGAEHNNCSTEQNTKVNCMMRWGQLEGKSTGVVTTARVTHATPGPTYAHTVNRDWEADSLMPEENNGKCKDIASQLIDGETGQKLQVILGGGAQYFVPNDTKTHFGENGLRSDKRNLIEEWKTQKQANKQKYQNVNTQKELNELDPQSVDYVLGLFSDSHMSYELDRNKSADGEPSLADMTKKAIQILSKNKRGFILMVEGALIDIAHHFNWAKRALTDTLALEKAVETALQLVNTDETLILVTADHAHAMTFSGYPSRGNSILGFGGISDVDSMPYTTLMYSSGNGFNVTDNHRPNITDVDTADKEYKQLATVPDTYAYHGGEDVLLYAIGPKSDLFYTIKEQHYIAHAVAFASNVCQRIDNENCSIIMPGK